MEYSITIDESALSNIKKGDKVKVVYEALDIDCDCIVEDVEQDGSIKLRRE